MKLSEAKPCANCGGPLLRPPMGTWYVLRISQAMVNPNAANAVLGTAQILGGHRGLAEVMAPAADDAIWILGDKQRELMTEIHLCFDCATSELSIAMLVEAVNRRTEEAPR